MQEMSLNLYRKKSICPKITLAILSFTVGFIMPLSAQRVSISGKMAGLEGEEIELVSYDDYISFKEIVLAKETISQDGNYNLNCSIKYTREAIIRIKEHEQYRFTLPRQ